VTRHELVIATLPNRTGLYLCKQEGPVIRPLARFVRGPESAEEFVSWAVKAGIIYEDARKEIPDGVLRPEAEEAGVGAGKPGQPVRPAGATGEAPRAG
jgi:hypothetical protein